MKKGLKDSREYNDSGETGRTKAAVAAAVALATCFFLLVPSSPGVPAGTPSYKGAPGTIAHDFLDLEKDMGSGREHYAEVDRLINRAMSLIKTKERYTSEEAVGILKTIHTLLKDEGYVFRNNLLLSTGIRKKTIDCDNYCALYVAIAEVLRIPILPVYAPNHGFIRFCFHDDTYLNWETTEGLVRTDAYYIEKLRIHKGSIQRGVYMKNLSRKEFIAVEYNNIGAYLMTRKHYEKAVPYFNTALKLYPLFSSAWHNRGTCYYGTKRPDESLADLLKAVDLDPSSATSYNTMGDIHFDRKDYDRALKEYAAGIRIDPTNFVPYHSIGLIMNIQGKKEDAQKWFEKSEVIRKKYGR